MAALGEEARVQGFALAGALAVAAGTPEEVRRAWRELPPDVVLVVLTRPAAEALTAELADPDPVRLTAVMPP
jgi:vacuolar-type H+-ATPase subunit F/Vma7